jgi:hypothetical protein
MDPEATLAELRTLCAQLRTTLDEVDAVSGTPAAALIDQAEQAVEAFTALDGWLTRGGFAPRDWQPPQVLVLVERIHDLNRPTPIERLQAVQSQLASLAVELAEQILPSQVPS